MVVLINVDLVNINVTDPGHELCAMDFVMDTSVVLY